jgi:integrase
MGCLTSLGNKRFRIRYDVLPENGRRRQRTETLENTTKKAAYAALADRESKATRGFYSGNDTTTFGEFFDTFMTKKREAQKPRAASTLNGYDSLYSTYLKPWFADMRLSKITSLDVENALRSWRAPRSTGKESWKKRPTASARTHRHAFDLLRNVLNLAVRMKLVGLNVIAQVDQDEIPMPVKPETDVLTADELRRVLESAKNPSNRSKSRGYISAYSAYFPALAFLAYTGARRGEALALRWSDLDLDRGCVSIRRSLSDVKKTLTFKRPKNGKSHTESIRGPLVEILRNHQQVQAEERHAMGAAYQDNDLVFARADGSPIPPWNFGATFPDLIRRAGVTKVRLHDLRHTHVSLLAKAGQPLEVVSKRLGHANISITADRYLHFYSEQDEAASEAFAAALRG